MCFELVSKHKENLFINYVVEHLYNFANKNKIPVKIVKLIQEATRTCKFDHQIYIFSLLIAVIIQIILMPTTF